MTVLGPELKVGDKAPDFEAVDNGLKAVTLATTGDGIRIFSVIPSLDTPVCDAQTKRFEEETGKLPNVSIYTISMDLPFAQKRQVRRVWRGSRQNGVGSPDRFLRGSLRHPHQGSAHSQPRDICGG